MRAAFASRAVFVIGAIAGAVGACRGVIGIEELKVATDAGADVGTSSEAGTDGGVDSAPGRPPDVQNAINKCQPKSHDDCGNCCATELAPAFAQLLTVIAIPDAGCACGPPESGNPCGPECGGTAPNVCPQSPEPPVPSTKEKCTSCITSKFTKTPGCGVVRDACIKNKDCGGVVDCLQQCP